MLQRRRLQEEGQQEEKERGVGGGSDAPPHRGAGGRLAEPPAVPLAALPALLAPRPRVLPPNHTHPVNAASEGREGGQGVAVVDVGWRFNLTWGAPVRGTARGAAVWLPGSNTTLLQRTSNLLCREEVLPAVVPVEEEGEEEEEEGEDEKKEGGSEGRGANQRAVQTSPTAQPFVPSESQLESMPFLADLRGQALLAVMRSLALSVAHSPRAAAALIFLRSALPSHFTGGTFQSGGRCHMHAEPLSPATACPHAADCRDAAAEEAVAAASAAVAAATAAATAGTEAGAATMPAAPPSASAVPTSMSGQPSIPWLRLLDAFPLSLMRPDTHVVAFHPLPNALPLPHPFTSEKPLLPHEAVNGSVVGRGGGGAGGVRVGGMTRDCVHWCLPGVPDI
ncbi:unnamed protein product [Closterium sp. Naga37s-1]|nr:unnamed protein product [Closterium sp. Naga37s-1]CAI5524126.1 unnamed protein product [Closterium sp. Naga37s-1]